MACTIRPRSDVWTALFATSASPDVQREAERGRLLLFTAESLYEPEPSADGVDEYDHDDHDDDDDPAEPFLS